MIAAEFDRFAGVLVRLSKVYGKAVDDDMTQSYWHALRDLSWETVSRKADDHLKRGRFFPKPAELRPKDTTPVTESDERTRREFEAAEQRCAAFWDRELEHDYIGTKWLILRAYEARTDLMPAADREQRRRFVADARARLLVESGGVEL